MGEQDYLKQFVSDMRDIFVHAARNDAVDRAPQPRPVANVPTEMVYRVQSLDKTNTLVISFSREIPYYESQYEAQVSETKIREVYTKFCKIAKGQIGKQLLEEIASFPQGLVFRAGDQRLSVNQLKAMKDPRSPSGVFSSVQKIDVTWRTAYEGVGHQDYDTDGKFDSIIHFDDGIVRPSTHYTIWVRFKNDLDKNVPGIWPNIQGVQNIAFTHKKAASRMTLNLFHEVIHIWFHYKYWWHEMQSGNTGHGKYVPPFWDEIDGTYPFYDRIVTFYKEIDNLEQPTPK